MVPVVSIVVPAFDEADNVALLHRRIVDEVEPFISSFEIVFVDDGSRDDTFEVLRQIARADPRVVAVKLRRNYGQTPAMTAGIDAARGSILVTMDADLQNDPADIPALVDKVKEGFDMAVGFRLRRQDKFWSRKVPSKAANWLIGKVTGLPIIDNGCSLKAYRAGIIKRVPLYSDLHRFIPSMAIPLGVSVAQIGVRHHARQHGVSKYGLSRTYKVLLDLITVRLILGFSARPLSGFTGASMIFVLLAVLVALFIGRSADGSNVVAMTTTALLGSLGLFLFASGVVLALIQVRMAPQRVRRAAQVYARLKSRLQYDSLSGV